MLIICVEKMYLTELAVNVSYKMVECVPSTQLRTQSSSGFGRHSTVRQDGLIKEWKTSVRTESITREHLKT
jgi:hypothetical protein